MKSMALRGPDKLIREATAIADGGSELTNSKFATLEASNNHNDAAAAKGTENPQERRQALGHKRCRSYLKCNPSQPSVLLEPILDVRQQQDPEEYLLALEMLKTSENSKESIAKKDKKIPQDRRPGLGRKRAQFCLKPHSSQPSMSLEPSLDIDQLQDPDEFFPGHEKLEYAKKEIQRQRGGNMTELNERNPSYNTRLHQPWTLGKSYSYKHNYSSVLSKKGGDLTSSQETLQLDIPSSSNRHLLQEKIDPNVESHEKELTGSISKTEKRVNKFLDKLLSFENENFDGDVALSFIQEHMHIKPIDLDKLGLPDFQEIDQVTTWKEFSISNKSKSLVEDGITNTTLANTGSQKVLGDSVHLFDKSVNDNLSKLGVGIGARLRESHGDLEDRDRRNDVDMRLINETASSPNGNTDVWTCRRNMEENAEDMLQETASSAQPEINIEGSTRSAFDTDFQQHGADDMPQETATPAEQDTHIEDSTTENLKNSLTQLDQSDPTAVEDHPLDTVTPEINLFQRNEECPKLSSNDRSKASRQSKGRQRKVPSRRQTLAEAGSLWKSGLRRSSRITRRPLDYWKGERFLYGRVHDSLPTVIGLKYISPGKGEGEPTFRVQSYVSDDYKELVELAALH